MLIEQTLDKLNAMKLGAMADACQQQIQTDEAASLSFEERFGLLVDAEWTAREQRKLQRRLRTAKLRHPATLEAVDFTHPRRLNRQQVLTLGACAWVAERHNLILIGPTGIGKSFLCCAFVERACRRGFSARYVRMPRLLHELAVGRGDGSYARFLTRLAKLDLLAIDDWMIAPLRDAERRDLTEVIEDRAERASTLIASQLPVTDWHAVIGDANQSDAICDRLLHDAHRIELQGRCAATDAPRPEGPHAGDGHEQPNAGLHPRSEARPGPARRQSRRGRPMYRAGGMENAHETLAAECTGVEARFPHRLGRHKTPPTRSTGGRSLYSLNTTSRVGLVHPLRNRWEETDRPTSLRSDERSRSPESVFTFPGSGVQLHRNAQIEGGGRSITRRLG